MTIHLASPALDLDEEWAAAAPIRLGGPAPVPPAVAAAEALRAEGKHTHLVSDGEVQCNAGCVPLPGV
ncbi:hypothetical protein [Streptomyces erythrochromogenes]|uniref:hypothetical protein n=1 Tax=Streptomyces erythrochromogenes TaxID=285574 RepID=UPI0036B316A1